MSKLKNCFKLLSLSAVLLLGFTTNQSQSYDSNKINLKSNLLITNALDKKEIKTVIANGYGSSLESAAQNAAQNALTNVVGTFIDSRTMLEKRAEILDGIYSESSLIKKNINSYSQGSINYFEILNSQQNGSIYQVTARVDVKIDDFRAYIKKLALKTKEISTTNLVVKMKAKKNNLDNKFKFIPEIITPIFEGEVSDIEINDELRSIDDLYNDENCRIYFGYRFCKPYSKDFFKYLNKEKTVYFTFTVKLKKDFYTNVINTLENISDLKTSSVTSYNGKDSFNRIAKNNSYNFWDEQDVGFIIRENKKQVHSQYFILKNIGNRAFLWNSSGEWGLNKYILNFRTKKLKIDLLDSNGEILYSVIEKCDIRNTGQYHDYGFEGGLKNLTLIHGAYFKDSYVGKTNHCPSQLYSTRWDINKNSILFDITNRKRYMFAFEINDINQLKDIHRIRIKYIN